MEQLDEEVLPLDRVVEPAGQEVQEAALLLEEYVPAGQMVTPEPLL